METTLSPATVGALTLKWTYPVGARVINTQPIVASNVAQPVGPNKQVVYVGDEIADFYAIDAASGQPVWSQLLGKTMTPCGSATDGVTATPVIDRSNNRIYVLDGLGTLRALDLGTGAESPGFPPVVVYGGTGGNNITWSALLLSPDKSLVYLPTSSHSDTVGCGTYFGTVNSVNTMTQAVTTFQVVQNPSQYYGDGVWSWGGESIDPDTGNLFAGVGNSWGNLGETGANSDSILELNPSLGFVADEQPEQNLANDLDIGTTPVLFDEGGSECLAVTRKDGNLFTIDRTNLQNLSYQSKLHIGGQLPTVAYDPVTNALFAAVPKSLTKIDVGTGCQASVEWQTSIVEQGGFANVPVVANGVVYVAGGTGNATLYAVDAASGAILWNSGSSVAGPIVPEPTIVNGNVYVSAWGAAPGIAGRVYAFGLSSPLRIHPRRRR